MGAEPVPTYSWIMYCDVLISKAICREDVHNNFKLSQAVAALGIVPL